MAIEFGQELQEERLVSVSPNLGDEPDNSLRPRFLTDYTGQEKAKENLAVYISAAKLRGEPLDHVVDLDRGY